MAKSVHITKRSSEGWAVERADAGRASSVHRTQAEAIAAGRRLALKSGGAEVVIHGVDGRIRGRDTIGAGVFDEVDKREARAAEPRAPRSEGPRTTLRVPDQLAEVAERVARDLGISRNDALLRLATRGARLYEQEMRIASRRAERWAAVVPGVLDIDAADFPSPDEARAEILSARDETTPTAG